jgi:hypothetical protein
LNDLRIEKNIAECNKHLKRINSAFVKMSAFMPIDSEKYLQLTDDEVEHIDQFLFRFSKLQDAMGEKLFVLLLEFMQEESVKSRPFIDILNRLEQLGLLDDKNIWLELRKIRNNIAHQYDDEPQQAADALNAIYAAKPVLENIYTAIIASYNSMKQRLQA